MTSDIDINQIAFVASPTAEAVEARERLVRTYGDTAPQEADVIVALGGDGLMLHALHDFADTGTPIYGMNRGSVGFLMNEFHEDDLLDRLRRAETTVLHPLRMQVVTTDGGTHDSQAFNEVSLIRQTYQAAKLRISIDGTVRLDELICDGVLVATPAGSTAYNLSAHGPIIPINAPLLALTPISAFRPRRWRGALLPNGAHVRIDINEPDKRPVSAAADHVEIRHVASVDIREASDIESLIMFDPDHGWDERILTEQFRY